MMRAFDRPTKPLVGRPALDALGAIVAGTGFATGDAFFTALVRSLVGALGVKHAFIGVVEDPPAFTRARTLAVIWDGELAPDFVYELEGSPCEEVLAAGETAYHPQGVAKRFPRDLALARRGIESYLGTPLWGHGGEKIGLLVVMDDGPLDASLEPAAILEIFAQRAAAELERMRADEALRAERDFSKAVLETSAAALMVVSPDRRIVYANEAMALVLDVPRERLLGGDSHASVWSVTAPDGGPFPEHHSLDHVLRTGASITGAPGLIRRPDREPRIVTFNAVPLRDAAGRIAGAVLAVEDVTEQRAIQEQLAHAHRTEAIGRLAGGVAHDFNNLLTVILSHAQLAEVEAPAGGSVRELVALIREAAQRASSLTRQLLAFARKQAVEPRVLDLNAVVQELGRLLQRLLGETVALGVRLARDPWTVRADPGHVEQVLVNLAVNARDAMPAGGRLAIETSNEALGSEEARTRGLPAGDYVRISVSDTGEGMDEETRRRAFEPFFSTKGERGTGLGLATCLGIVQQAGGQMWVESAPGAGSTFHVLLPRHAEAARATARPALTPRPRSAGPATVLVVEDDEAVRATAVRALRRAGYGILQAATGPEALRVAADHPGDIDLLLSDMVLPGMNGRELAERLVLARRDVRVLFVSGYAGEGPQRNEVVEPVRTKPYTPDELVAWVEEALAARRAESKARSAG